MIEYVKVKHDEECYICHSRENVKTLRVAADSSNAANTIAFCDKCAGTVSRVLNVPMTFERSLDGEAICPHCKKPVGWREVTPIHGHYSVCYDENGDFFEAAYSEGMNYYYKSTTYECLKCNRNIKGAVLRYKKEQGND